MSPSIDKAPLSDLYPVRFFVALSDILLVVFSGLSVHYWLFEKIRPHDRFIIAIAIMVILTVLMNTANEGYSRWRTTSLRRLLWRLLIAWIAVGSLTGTIIYFTEEAEHFPRTWMAYTLSLSFTLVIVSRVLGNLLLWRMRVKGINRRSVFLIGPNNGVKSIVRRMRKHQEEGFSVAGMHRFSSPPDKIELEQIAARVAESGAREVWICLPLDMGRIVKALMYALRNETAEVRFIPEFSDIPLLNHRVSEVVGRYAIDLSVTPMAGAARVLKRSEDIVLGSIITLIILPICLAIAIAVKLTSPGPILFKQYRTGVNGRKFKVYKFRSMTVHEEKNWITQAKKGDSRVTPVGAFLRRTSLDELPQFYNVLQGRMSIVGPRPHALAHNEYYKDLVESYMRRHKMKPGITGWAQVNGFRGETDTLDKMQKRVEFDLWYIDNWSILLDLKIIFFTIFKGFVNKNAY